LLQRLDRPRAPAEVAQTFIGGYPIEPGREGCLPAEAADAGENTEEDLLGHVGRFRGPDHANGQPIDSALVALVQAPLSAALPGPAARDDIRQRVGHALPLCHYLFRPARARFSSQNSANAFLSPMV